MAGSGNDWNSLMQSRTMRLALNGVCTLLCAYYALDAVFELVSPGGSATLVEALGTTGYYALTIARLVVCLWAAVAFGRASMRTMAERDDGGRR